ncbi:Holliday junction resolvase RuvX [Candidatus Falkowbacteria bacterium]|nr:Holliday junction resolvase RuvX [Candidatus Falkowbacteria bacterium]
MTKYLGIDWGEKKIGLALGSSETGLAVVHGVTDDTGYIKELCKDDDIDVVVVGELRDKNKNFDEFVDFLNTLGVRVELADERLTTKMAGNLDKSLKGKDDAVAAQIILQDFIDAKLRK